MEIGIVGLGRLGANMARRLARHYMKAGLLESQFAALEEPVDALSVDIDDTPDAIADSIVVRLQASPARRLG